MFDDILERRKTFLDSKMRKLKKSQNQDISKGSMVLVKNLEIFDVSILTKSASKMCLTIF